MSKKMTIEALTVKSFVTANQENVRGGATLFGCTALGCPTGAPACQTTDGVHYCKR